MHTSPSNPHTHTHTPTHPPTHAPTHPFRPHENPSPNPQPPVCRKLPDMVASTDPRRGVLQIERRERAKHDAKLTAEREELLKAAQSKWVAALSPGLSCSFPSVCFLPVVWCGTRARS